MFHLDVRDWEALAFLTSAGSTFDSANLIAESVVFFMEDSVNANYEPDRQYTS